VSRQQFPRLVPRRASIVGCRSRADALIRPSRHRRSGSPGRLFLFAPPAPHHPVGLRNLLEVNKLNRSHLCASARGGRVRNQIEAQPEAGPDSRQRSARRRLRRRPEVGSGVGQATARRPSRSRRGDGGEVGGMTVRRRPKVGKKSSQTSAKRRVRSRAGDRAEVREAPVRRRRRQRRRRPRAVGPSVRRASAQASGRRPGRSRQEVGEATAGSRPDVGQRPPSSRLRCRRDIA
jgi:hypothetical protein